MSRLAAHLPLLLESSRGAAIARQRRATASRHREDPAAHAAAAHEPTAGAEASGPGGWLDSSYILRDGLSVIELESLDAWLEAQHVP